ncbi:hypothetical protein SKAU_G00417420 [Synaphobranchus kaupii]|uniref:Uncharacterized protein n=1 Tax=Synaphobranchus kaupii TaxID=118154 RepID=A0A9Q1E5Z7_SYNKA|nr:hypothetical protein SKAU_G00417420 [Synaphobranchus kaupii]
MGVRDTLHCWGLTLLILPAKRAELLIALLVGIVLTGLAVALVAIIYFKSFLFRRKAEAQTEELGSTKGAQAAVNTSTAELPQPQRRGPAFSTQEEEVSYASVHFKQKKPKR